MLSASLQKKISFIYLLLVPVVTAAAGFGIGHISYLIYVPIWLLNACGMLIAAWTLGAGQIKGTDHERRQQAFTGLLFVLPWIFIFIFFGMGPPPETPQGWIETATEQQVRYTILILSGIIVVLGSVFLKEILARTKGSIAAIIGFTFIIIAAPLFLLNMMFWNNFLIHVFRIQAASGATDMPGWYTVIREYFGIISVVEVALIYAATAAFAAALGAAGFFSKTACRIYTGISLTAMVLIIASGFSTGILANIGFFISIPAIPFIMPYLIGVNLLRRAGAEQ